MDRLVSLNVSIKGDEDFFQTFQDLSELAANLSENHGYVTVSANRIDDVEVDESEERLFYDENTLPKVSKVLMDLGVDSELAADIITHCLAAGILFRERVR